MNKPATGNAMLLARDHRRGHALGLLLALAYAAIAPLEAMTISFAAPFTVQDDARQFLFWMASWRDPALFAGDPIAEYFRDVTPSGFKALHWMLDRLGLEPFLANKLLPLPLFLASGFLAYRIAWRLYPVAAVAVAASWLTCFFLGLIDQTLLSAVPRAFAVPLFLWLIDGCIRRSAPTIAVAAALQGLFYPPIALVSAAVLGLSLLRWWGHRPMLALDPPTLFPALWGFAAIFVTMLPFVLGSGGHGAIISAADAAASPAFQAGGRSAFYLGGPIETYLCGARAGFLPVEWGCGEAFRQGVAVAPFLAVALLSFALLVPIALAVKGRNGRSGHAPESAIFLAVIGAGLFWFLAAHVLLFELHLPSRYTQHPLRATAWIAAALLAGPPVARWLQGRKIAGAVACLVAVAFFVLPVPLPPSPYANYVTGKFPGLYAFLEKQPKDTSVASLSPEADNIPSLAKRPVQVAREYAIPYASGYMKHLREKTEALIRAQYAVEPRPLLDYLNRFSPKLLLIDETAFGKGGAEKQWWAADYPDQAAWAERQSRTGVPFVVRVLDRCSVFTSYPLALVSPRCIVIEVLKFAPSPN